MAAFRFPRYWWGLPGTELVAPTHSVLDLLGARVLDAQVAALLWALLVRRASLLLVGGWARGTGKTTTLTALAGFFPAGTDLVVARGVREDFDFLQRADPARTYIMAGEFSDHTPAYVWGEAAARIWRLTAEGYRFGGTMHAEGIESLIQQVSGPPVALGSDEIARALQLTVFLAAFQGGETRQRRITGVHWVQPASRGPGGLGAKSLVAWSAADDRWTLFSSPDTWADLARWGGASPGALQQEVAARHAFLERLAAEDVRGFDTVRERLLEFPG